MQRDAPYLDVNKHNEHHPYYNVPLEASGDQKWRRAFPSNQTISDQTIISNDHFEKVILKRLNRK